MTFEEQYKALEEILGRLERGDLTLDQSLAEYERGVGALKSCREVLSKAERRIEELSIAGVGEAPGRAR
jgi:exodeoxyribonuclease VII small subunit